LAFVAGNITSQDLMIPAHIRYRIAGLSRKSKTRKNVKKAIRENQNSEN